MLFLNKICIWDHYSCTGIPVHPQKNHNITTRRTWISFLDSNLDCKVYIKIIDFSQSPSYHHMKKPVTDG